MRIYYNISEYCALEKGVVFVFEKCALQYLNSGILGEDGRPLLLSSDFDGKELLRLRNYRAWTGMRQE